MQVTPKAQILYILKQRSMTQSDLAQQTGLGETTLRTTLSSPLMRSNSHWPTILDTLGLELVIRPKRDPS